MKWSNHRSQRTPGGRSVCILRHWRGVAAAERVGSGRYMDDPRKKLRASKLTIYCGIAMIPLSLLRLVLEQRFGRSDEELVIRFTTGPVTGLVMGAVIMFSGIYLQRYWNKRSKDEIQESVPGRHP